MDIIMVGSKLVFRSSELPGRLWTPPSLSPEIKWLGSESGQLFSCIVQVMKQRSLISIRSVYLNLFKD